MPSLRIETHRREDDEKIFDLQQCVYPNHHLYKDRELTRQYWQWRYFSHPHNKSQVFVVHDKKKNTIAGMRPITFIPIQLNGENVLSASLTAVITHPDYRRRGIFSNLLKHSMEVARQQGARFAFTFPNDKSYAIYKKKAEWHYVTAISLYVKVLQSIPLLRIGLNPSKRLPQKIAAKFEKLSIHKKSTPSIQDDRGDLKIVTTSWFGHDYDQLWSNVEGRFYIAIRRDSSYLNWRYFQNPISDYTVLEARRKTDNTLIGYMVLSVQVRDKMNMGLIVDVLVGDEFSCAYRALVRTATEYFRSLGVTVALCVMNTGGYFSRALIRYGYVPIPNRLSPKKFHMIYSDLSENDDNEAFISNPDHWYLTWGDTDNV